MSILYYSSSDQGGTSNDRILSGLREKLPHKTISVWPDCPDKTSITTAIVWQPPIDFFDGLSNLKHVLSIAAGVDHLLGHPALPKNVSVTRLTDAGMAEPMAQYVLYGVLHAQRQMTALANAQRNQLWRHDISTVPTQRFHVGILGAGVLSLVTAKRLVDNGYKVSCWSRTPKQLQGIAHFDGADGLEELLPQVNALVCLLPLTPQTTGILNASLFAKLPVGAYLINPGRGGHADETALLDALNSDHLSGALLDVFNEEPLPPSSPIWSHPNIVVTPHVAAPTHEDGAVEQIAQSIDQLERDEIPHGMVNRDAGY